MTPRTKRNLLSAMKCDAFESALYSRFAAHARMESDWDLAKVFQDGADRDRTEHFAREATLEGIIAESSENLRNAIDSGLEESNMYSQFALEAAADGDIGAKAAFEQISRERAERCAKLEGVLAAMGIHSNIKPVGA